MPRPSWIPLALALVSGAASAQDDERDQVLLTSGRVVRGRVATPYASEELLVVNGGKRTRVAIADVGEIRSVATDVAAFFARRLRHRDSPRALRYLVDWAVQHKLPGLARLQAMELVLRDDDDEKMHAFLGHRQRRGAWQWRRDGQWRSRDQLEQSMADRPLTLRGERFTLSCDAGLLTNVRALFDLEHLAVVWFDRFGADLALREVLEPIAVRTFRSADAFPKWGFRPRPYFEPPPHSDLGRTFYSGAAPARPEALFFVGAQGLLYRTIIGEADRQDSRGRVCAWLEVGLGMHLEQLMRGPAGFAAPDLTRPPDLVALRALGRGYRLTHLVHLPMYGSFYLTDNTATATNWAAAEMFVTWLLAADNKQKLRRPFLDYVIAALRDRKGDSSTAFDRIIGTPIERLEEPWLEWLHEIAGN
ncbi:MAG: hypothetical protein VX044_00410 [Planctomycetota bacterium]|nr:hypothetical protein [Planctomycetota bacterium]